MPILIPPFFKGGYLCFLPCWIICKVLFQRGGGKLNHMMIKDIEISLAKDIVSLRKQTIGKGPEDIQVKIFRDTIIVKGIGVWSPAEQHLLSFIEENQLMSQLYESVLEKAKPKLEEILCAYGEVQVLNVIVQPNIERNHSHGLIILDRNFEKQLKLNHDR